MFFSIFSEPRSQQNLFPRRSFDFLDIITLKCTWLASDELKSR